MQINQLPTIPQAPANADVLAIEVGGVTYKVSKSALASAILGTIDSAPTQSSANLVKSGGVYNAIAQATAFVTEYVNIGAEDMLAKIAQMNANKMIYFRTTSTTTNGPGTGLYLIGTAIRANANILINASEMEKPEIIYQNSTINGGTSWKGWKKFTGTAV